MARGGSPSLFFTQMRQLVSQGRSYDCPYRLQYILKFSSGEKKKRLNRASQLFQITIRQKTS